MMKGRINRLFACSMALLLAVGSVATPDPVRAATYGIYTQDKSRVEFQESAEGTFADASLEGVVRKDETPVLAAFAPVPGENQTVLEAWRAENFSEDAELTLSLTVKELPLLAEGESIALYRTAGDVLQEAAAEPAEAGAQLSLQPGADGMDGIALVKNEAPKQEPALRPEYGTRKAYGDADESGNVIWQEYEQGGTVTLLFGVEDGSLPAEERTITTPLGETELASRVTQIVLEDGIAGIGANVFRGFQKLKGLFLPEGFSEIAAGAFAGCRVPFTNIGDGCFAAGEGVIYKITEGSASLVYAPYGLSSYTVPEQITAPDGAAYPVEQIASAAFLRSVNLTEILFENAGALTAVGARAFANLKSLARVSDLAAGTETHVLMEAVALFTGASVPVSAFLGSGLESAAVVTTEIGGTLLTAELVGYLPKNATVWMEAAEEAEEDETLFAIDISIYDESGKSWQPTKPVTVLLTSELIRSAASDGLTFSVRHRKTGGGNELLVPEASEASMNFDTTAFGVFSVKASLDLMDSWTWEGALEQTEAPLQKAEETVEAPQTQEPLASFDVQLSGTMPSSAAAAVTEQVLTDADMENLVQDNSEAAAAEGAGVLFAADITLSNYDTEIQPMWGALEVSVSSDRIAEALEAGHQLEVWHISVDENGEETRNLVEGAVFEGSTATFPAESFSVYAIVEAPLPVPLGWMNLTSMNELEALGEGGVYISTQSGFFLRNIVVKGTSDKNTSGIEKIKPAQSSPPADAALYYFVPADGEDMYYIYCLSGDGSRQYVRNTGDQNLTFTAEPVTAFHVLTDNAGKFRMHNGNRYWNMWNSTNGNHIAAWTTAGDTGNYFYLWQNVSTEEDPYGLDGASYGLMNWTGGVTGKALMASSAAEGSLDSLVLTVMSSAKDNDDKLFAPADSDITLWTFHWDSMDRYYVTANVKGSTKYLRLTANGPSMVSARDEACSLRVLPGTGSHEGEICLIARDGAALTYSGRAARGFTAGGSAGSEWLKLVDLSELTSDYFLTWSAKKVSVSDADITNGSRIIVYTRAWDDVKKKYIFYAINKDGDLMPCYESGDSIQWVGGILNEMLWNFVEYYDDNDNPNYYYDLYNQFSEKYLAPQISGGQILSSQVLGLNMNGRRNGNYYSTIVAWDTPHYTYAGLKVEDGRIVSCPFSEADDFYFAVMQDLPVDDQLTPVETIDHTQYGITMKLVNFDSRESMSSYLGSDNGYKKGNTEPGLLSTALGSNGYPTTKAGKSLSGWFGGAEEVNHLFIRNTYQATGYYEFNSVQNFAHYSGNGDFVVYRELGATDKSGAGPFYAHGQFFPFNDLQAGVFGAANPKNLYAPSGASLPESDPRKYERLYLVPNPDFYFGTMLEASFTQTPDGLDAWGHDIIYEFTGDDDFWLYVDGELVIDLGGIHDALPGSVNFSTGQVSVNGKQTTLQKLFYDNYRGRGNSAAKAQAYVDRIFVRNEQGQYIFRDYSTHTMKIFYLERGAGASNLHMRFNLASVKAGTVELSKELAGVDKSETILAEFPYQIYYKLHERGEALLLDGTDEGAVCYKDTSTPVTYEPEFTVDGIVYRNVFLLKPGETAEINIPGDAISYEIVECGVNTEVYGNVSVNGYALKGRAVKGSRRMDFGTGYASTAERARAAFVNTVNPGAIRNLTITKELYREDGTTPLSHEEDDAQFEFRLSLGTEFDPAPGLAYIHSYHVKDPENFYCSWDAQANRFVSTGISEYDRLSAEQKEAATFYTSINGAMSHIPAFYSVEIRHLLAGTKWNVVERPRDIPDGYSFQKFVYGGEEYTDPLKGVSDVISAKKDQYVILRNLRGYGLRVNKVWADEGYMEEREPVYFALYAGETAESPVADSVRQMSGNMTSLYWYYLQLPVGGVSFDSYVIREVTISNPNPAVGEDGAVADPGEVVPVEEGGTVKVTGRQKGETETSAFSYRVHYEKGTVQEGSNVRVDTVTNDRSGIVLKKQDWAGNPLAGAVFTLEDENGSLVGTFTSDENGFLSAAFLRDGAAYVLTETKAPRGYSGLEAPLSIVKNGAEVTVSGVGEESYELTNDGEGAVLTVKNRPFTFKAVKRDGMSMEPLSEVRFDLHRQVTVDHFTEIDLNPMPGYAGLLTGTDGVVPGLDNTLAAEVYELREKEAPSLYLPLSFHIRFTVTANGRILLDENHPKEVTLEEEILADGTLAYTMTILNNRDVVSPTGLHLPVRPFLWMLLAGGILLLFAVGKKRRKY